ncbi:MAG: TetR/AcrR family transcriptional regulator [Candidatus Galacturonibacter soehngenii]|nr:TetR/AcrR family transcriptional regulator [Candidatus Galacturonibacter soehngenii]
MNQQEKDTRQLIIDTAKDLINETGNIEEITVRQIAKRAEVGIGLINYHFKSKDNLLSEAVGDVMSEMICKFTKEDSNSMIPPVVKLKALLKELYSFAGRNEKLIHFILNREVVGGDFKTALYLISFLKEIFGENEEEMKLRIIALQILLPIQVTGLNEESFLMYSGIDLSNVEQRERFIDALINNLMKEKG